MKFSIVVATYNRSVPLKRCVESILSQSYRDLELLVIDDGSTDATDDMISKFNDERLRYIKLNKNHGSATPARNRGIEEMSGEVLVIWDSDDLLLSHALETLVDGFKRFDAGIVCASTIFYEGGKMLDYPRVQTGLLTKQDWVSGRKSRDAEIIAVRREYIGDTRFMSRGIDFMFYVEIIAGLDAPIAYLNETCGYVFLESDDLSLTKQRKKMNIHLSQERGEILDSFLLRYKSLYFDAQAYKKYAGYAYGAAVGLLLAGNQSKAIRRAWQSFFYSKKIGCLVFFMFSLLPFASYFFLNVVRIRDKF